MNERSETKRVLQQFDCKSRVCATGVKKEREMRTFNNKISFQLYNCMLMSKYEGLKCFAPNFEFFLFFFFLFVVVAIIAVVNNSLLFAAFCEWSLLVFLLRLIYNPPSFVSSIK